MCQMLLMHLDKPERAIAEMKRILKPGGTIFCTEPDNYSSSLQEGFFSGLELSLEEQLVEHKINYYRFKGKKKLKLGDHTIGNKLPKLYHQAGFRDINIRINDIAYYMVPSYEMDFQRRNVENLRKIVNKENIDELKFYKDIVRRDVLAGGGSEYLLRKHFSIIDNKNISNCKKAINQIEQEDYFSCCSGIVYGAKATK